MKTVPGVFLFNIFSEITMSMNVSLLRRYSIYQPIRPHMTPARLSLPRGQKGKEKTEREGKSPYCGCRIIPTAHHVLQAITKE